MQKTDFRSFHPSTPFRGMLYIAAALICIVLGLVGLIIPVLPGIIFLALAVVFLAKVSSTIDRWVKKSPFMSTTQSRMESMTQLSWTDRLRLIFWYTGYGLARAGEFSARLLGRLRSARN